MQKHVINIIKICLSGGDMHFKVPICRCWLEPEAFIVLLSVLFHVSLRCMFYITFRNDFQVFHEVFCPLKIRISSFWDCAFTMINCFLMFENHRWCLKPHHGSLDNELVWNSLVYLPPNAYRFLVSVLDWFCPF